jgi:hypothetical protein
MKLTIEILTAIASFKTLNKFNVTYQEDPEETSPAMYLHG